MYKSLDTGSDVPPVMGIPCPMSCYDPAGIINTQCGVKHNQSTANKLEWGFMCKDDFLAAL